MARWRAARVSTTGYAVATEAGRAPCRGSAGREPTPASPSRPPPTARRTKCLWVQLSLGCHYHLYELDPPYGQVRVWRTEPPPVSSGNCTTDPPPPSGF